MCDFFPLLKEAIKNTEKIENRGDIVAIRNAMKIMTNCIYIDCECEDEDDGILTYLRFIHIWSLREPALIRAYCDGNFEMSSVIGTKVIYKRLPVLSIATSYFPKFRCCQVPASIVNRKT
jgi:hypothetical protein